MPEKKDELPLQAYIFGSVTEEERKVLAQQALADQNSFDELWDADEQRELLQDPVFRSRLAASLKAKRQAGWFDQLKSWLRAPQVQILAAAVLCLVAFFIVRPSLLKDPRDARFQTTTIATNPQSGLEPYFRLPLQNRLRINFRFSEASREWHAGQLIHGSLELQEPAAVFLLRREPQSGIRLVFPPDLATSPDLPTGIQTIAFDPLPPTVKVLNREHATLRLLALPAGMDIRTQNIDWAKIDRYSVLEYNFDVVP